MDKATKAHQEKINRLSEQPFEIRLSLIQNYFELARIMTNELFEDIVLTYTGERYSHDPEVNSITGTAPTLEVYVKTIRSYRSRYRVFAMRQVENVYRFLSFHAVVNWRNLLTRYSRRFCMALATGIIKK